MSFEGCFVVILMETCNELLSLILLTEFSEYILIYIESIFGEVVS